MIPVPNVVNTGVPIGRGAMRRNAEEGALHFLQNKK
jgi:hypothetical protein